MNRICARSAAVVFGFALSASAQALVVKGGGVAPGGDTWLGSWNGSSAVAVGQRTIVTAAHVGGHEGGVFTMGGASYAATSILTVPGVDLMVVTLDSDLPGWHDLASAALGGQPVVLGGLGFLAGQPLPAAVGWSDERAEAWG
ncbi:MAG TPA: hypothetical protein VG797_09420, partial [Phycisphaerales bacterium]|nr:hypothetical protein [Phycisphaerales bacterium]